METNGIDKKFKEVLEKRRIAPSEGAWDKLDDALGATATPKRKGYRWYGIAAGFTGIILISVLYFSGRQEGLVNPSAVVKAPEEEKEAAAKACAAAKEALTQATKNAQAPASHSARPTTRPPLADTLSGRRPSAARPPWARPFRSLP